MTKSMILHIGSPKTGTTSLQDALALAERTGALKPIIYPITKDRCSHLDVADSYTMPECLSRIPRHRYNADPTRFREEGMRFRRFVYGQLAGASRAILSAENFIHLAGPDTRLLRADLEALGYGEFLIVLYVRDPADYYLSQSQQTLKASSRIPDPTRFRCAFLRVADNWESAFPGRVSVRTFTSGQSVISDFATVIEQCFGLAIDLRHLRRNVSLSAEAMHILELYRSTYLAGYDDVFTPDTDCLTDLLAASQQSTDQTRPRLKGAIARLIRANHREETDILLSRYGVDLNCEDGETPSGTIPAQREWCVSDILESVDSQIVAKMLMGIAKLEIDRRSRPRRLLRRSINRLKRISGLA